MIRKVAPFCGMEVPAFRIMGNHFHTLWQKGVSPGRHWFKGSIETVASNMRYHRNRDRYRVSKSQGPRKH